MTTGSPPGTTSLQKGSAEAGLHGTDTHVLVKVPGQEAAAGYAEDNNCAKN
jgi:hypothetical protein